MEKIEELENEKCTDKVFNQYCELELKLEQKVNEHDAFEPLVSALPEPVVIVNVKNGQICEFETVGIYLKLFKAWPYCTLKLRRKPKLLKRRLIMISC